MSNLIYAVEATLNCTASETATILDHVDLSFHIVEGQPTSFVDSEGAFAEAGVEAMLAGFTAGVTGVIHAAGQRSGMDTAVLLRRAISMMEEQFVQQVEASKVQREPHTQTSDSDGT